MSKEREEVKVIYKLKKLLIIVTIMFCTFLFVGVTVSSENVQAATKKERKIKKNIRGL